MLQIFYKEKPIIISDNKTDLKNSLMIKLELLNNIDLIKLLNKKNIGSIGILSENEKSVISAFKNKFPELKSYKLNSLCEHFNIELKNHHRAYEDAKATFELFKILNEK